MHAGPHHRWAGGRRCCVRLFWNPGRGHLLPLRVCMPPSGILEFADCWKICISHSCGMYPFIQHHHHHHQASEPVHLLPPPNHAKSFPPLFNSFKTELPQAHQLVCCFQTGFISGVDIVDICTITLRDWETDFASVSLDCDGMRHAVEVSGPNAVWQVLIVCPCVCPCALPPVWEG